MRLYEFFYSIIIYNFCHIMDDLFFRLFSFIPVKDGITRLLRKDLFKDTKNVLLLLLILGILLRVVAYFIMPNLYGLQSDSVSYYNSAINGVEHGIYSTYWPPGLPFFISILYMMFNNYTIPILTMVLIIIGSLIGLVGYYMSYQIFKNRLAALLAFLFICFQPSLLIHSPQLLSDTFAVMIFGVSIYYLLKDELYSNKIPLILGVLVGFLVLLRPNYVFMIIIYFLLVTLSHYVMKIKVKKFALFILTLILTLTPWLIYTDYMIGEPVISTNGGVNFYIGNNPNANGRYTEPYGLTGDNMGYSNGLNYIITKPLSTLPLYLKKCVLLVSTPYILPWELPGYKFTSSEIIYSYGLNIGFIITELLGLRGLLLIIKQRRLIIFFACLILLTNLTLIPFFVDGRLTLPLLFIYTLFGSYYITRVIELTRNPLNKNKNIIN